MSNSFLMELTDLNDIEALRNLYRKDWPQHCVGFYCLDNFYKWKKLNPRNPNLKICTARTKADDGLYVIVDRYQLFFGSLDMTAGNCERLTLALSELDWSKSFKVSSFRECHRQPVLRVVESKKLQVEYDSRTVMYYLPRERALTLEARCPKGYYLQKLCSSKDAEVIDNLWPNRHEGSLFLIKRLIDWNCNMGIYVEETHELVAWCLRLQGGFLGALQVKENFKRLGLGSIVTIATAQQIAEQGDDVMALVNPDNTPSYKMFEKLGFTVVDNCYWLRTFPTLENCHWPQGE